TKIGPPPNPGPSPAAQIPRTRIQVDGAVALSPDGKWMAGSRGGRVRLFDVRTNEEVRTLAGGVQGGAVSLLFSPDGKWLAASGGTPSSGGTHLPVGPHPNLVFARSRAGSRCGIWHQARGKP